MSHFLKLKASYWLRIVLVLCGLLANAFVLNNYRKVGSDFVQDYIAAHSFRKGGSIYGETITKLSNEMLGFSDIQNFHPPFGTILFLPLSYLSYEAAYTVLGVLSLLLLLTTNRLVVKGFGLKNDWFLNITCFTLCWYPFIYCLGTGQSSMIIAASIIGGWLSMRYNKAYIAGICFALATLIKLFPGLVLLYLLLSKNWRVLFTTVLFITIGLILTVFIIGFNDIRTYTLIMIARDISEWRGFVLNYSIGGMLTRLFGEPTSWTNPIIDLSPYLSVMNVLFSSSLLVYTIQKMHKMVSKNELGDYAFGLVIVTMLLLSPITWGHVFPVLIFPIALLLKEYINAPSTEKLRSILIVLFCISLPDVLISRKLMTIYYPSGMPWHSMLLTLVPGAGLILLWSALCRRANK